MKNPLVLLIIVAAFALSSCGKVKGFEFRKIESWKINGLGFNSSSLSAHILMYNPNSFPVTLKRVEGNVGVEGSDLGICISDTTIRIASHQEFLIPVDIQLKTGAALLGGLAFLGKDSVIVKFDGFARLGRAGVFVNYKFKGDSKVATNF